MGLGRWIERGVIPAVVAAATVTLVGAEILKYDYETTKTALEAVGRFQDRFDAHKNTSACFWLIRSDAMRPHMEDLLIMKPFTLKSVDRDSRALFERCVADARSRRPVVPENADQGAVANRDIEIGIDELYEIRWPFIMMLNATDHAVGVYRNAAVNQAVICQNMFGNFWRGKSGGQGLEKTHFFEVLLRYRDAKLISEQGLPNLMGFMKVMESGKCPQGRHLLTRFVERFGLASFSFFDRLRRLVALPNQATVHEQ